MTNTMKSTAQFEAGGKVHKCTFGGRNVVRQACLAIALGVFQHAVGNVWGDEILSLQGHDGATQGNGQVAEVVLESGNGIFVAGRAHQQDEGLLACRSTGGIEALAPNSVALPADAPLGVSDAEKSGAAGGQTSDDCGGNTHDWWTLASVIFFLQVATWWFTTLRWERLYNEAVRWAKFEHEQYMDVLRKLRE